MTAMEPFFLFEESTTSCVRSVSVAPVIRRFESFTAGKKKCGSVVIRYFLPHAEEQPSDPKSGNRMLVCNDLQTFVSGCVNSGATHRFARDVANRCSSGP